MVANQQVDYAMRNGHVPVGFWRAPGQQNAFYRECFIDELAVAAGRDPVEFRLAMLKEGDKNRLVLEAVAKAAGWGAPLRPGVHRGVAVADGFGSFAAMVAEVSVSAAGEPRVERLVLAVDSGYVVNPDTCRAQAESNVVFGLGSILYQENNVKDGRIVESNFHDFPLPADLRDAEGRGRARAHRRLLGWARRARHPPSGSGCLQRNIRRHRQADPLAATQAPGTAQGLTGGRDRDPMAHAALRLRAGRLLPARSNARHRFAR